MSKNLLFRTDASPKIGSGHVMRCLAFAQAAKTSGIRSTFVMRPGAKELEKRLQSEECDVVNITGDDDSSKTCAIAKELNAEWIVIDGYTFDAEYQKALKDAGFKLLFIDDFGHCDHYSADIVLNQNIYAEQSFYQNRESYVHLLLGAKYVMLRQEFLLEKRSRTAHQSSDNVLVTMGGFDSHSLSGEIEHALKKSDMNVRVTKNATNMPELMTWADCAVSAAGTTTYELAYMGVPTAMIVTAENQKRVAEGMEKNGYGVNLGWYEDVQEDDIRDAVTKLKTKTQPSLIDGFGTERILAELFDWKFWLRSAQEEDCKLLFEWVNDPIIRESSFSPDQITWENHQEWFKKKCADDNCFMFLGIDRDEKAVGQVRFDVEETVAEIDVHVTPDMRGQGIGSLLIDAGVERLLAITGVSEVQATVKVGNEASMHAFMKAGFKRAREETIQDEEVLYFVRTRI